MAISDNVKKRMIQDTEAIAVSDITWTNRLAFVT